MGSPMCRTERMERRDERYGSVVVAIVGLRGSVLGSVRSHPRCGCVVSGRDGGNRFYISPGTLTNIPRGKEKPLTDGCSAGLMENYERMNRGRKQGHHSSLTYFRPRDTQE